MSSKEHALYCFNVLSSHLNGHTLDDPEFDDGNFNDSPLFVTWNTRSKSGLKLRGCIGCFNELSLHSGLKNYALIAALKDSRFQPISKTELPLLSCSVSLLTAFEPAKDHMDWEIGTHGIQIKYQDPVENVKRSATYLPEVASSQGWTKIETIKSLLIKSGFNGEPNKNLLSTISVTRYQSSKVSVDYDEYIVWKNGKHK